ncbi:hypothetical protein AB0M54_15700 [Actinoplanes sp. NPDC051470]
MPSKDQRTVVERGKLVLAAVTGISAGAARATVAWLLEHVGPKW